MSIRKSTIDQLKLPYEKPDLHQLIDEQSFPIQVYQMIKSLQFQKFYKKHQKKGAPNYPPEIMMTIILLSMSEGVFSSRKIEQKCKRDIYYLYITEQWMPDHATIARFIKNYSEEIADIATQVVLKARDKKIAGFEQMAIDGSKFMAASSKRHSMHEANLNAYIDHLRKRAKFLLEKIAQTDKRETKSLNDLDRKARNTEKRIQKAEAAQKELQKRQEQLKHKYHRAKHQINTEEPDARMMMPLNSNGYNVQVTVDTATGIIAAQSIEVSRNDYYEFTKQHQKTEKVLGENTDREYIADSGYLSEDALAYIEDKNITAYINDAREKDETPNIPELLKKNKKLTQYDFTYDENHNVYHCPNKKKFKEVKTGIYECHECQDCPLQHLCLSTRDYRTITRKQFSDMRDRMSVKVHNHPEKMNDRKAVERVFGQIKWNYGFPRFRRKGLLGAQVELDLWVLCINMVKILAIFSAIVGSMRKSYRLMKLNLDLIGNLLNSKSVLSSEA